MSSLNILSIYNPSEIIKYLAFYSPIILIVGVVSLSFIFQNFKGIFYLGVLLLLVVCREFVYLKMKRSVSNQIQPQAGATAAAVDKAAAKTDAVNTITKATTPIITGGKGKQKIYKGGASPDCMTVLYSTNLRSNGSYSAFIFAFTLTYIFLPMFINKNINVWMVVGLTMYFIFDTFVKNRSGCVDSSNAFVNVLVGSAISATLVCTMINTPGLSNLLFFNDYSSNKEVCTMPKNQTFKCAVYKNGELIGSSTT